jgi:hypothetical protein
LLSTETENWFLWFLIGLISIEWSYGNRRKTIIFILLFVFLAFLYTRPYTWPWWFNVRDMGKRTFWKRFVNFMLRRLHYQILVNFIRNFFLSNFLCNLSSHFPRIQYYFFFVKKKSSVLCHRIPFKKDVILIYLLFFLHLFNWSSKFTWRRCVVRL